MPLMAYASLHSSLCLSYSYGVHRDLHSFPTRRSSDLRANSVRPEHAHFQVRKADRHNSRIDGRSSVRTLSRRSEEHTSELQSLRHLVCRLLLEKKNTTRNRRSENSNVPSRVTKMYSIP